MRFPLTPLTRPRHRLIVTVIGLFGVLLTPAIARADTTSSDNWSGYAAHRTGVTFKKVSATWRQPSAICSSGNNTYSAFWVGIGGYSLTSDALEQVGSELDCEADGSESMSAWYELVPAPSRTAKLTVKGGDLITASVTVVGKQVTVSLTDKTRHESFSKTVTDHTIDTTSAEWITEAPSECSSTKCTTLPLADFGAVNFSGATAETAVGKTGAISSLLWGTTKIVLGAEKVGTKFISDASAVDANPSALENEGKAFSVAYYGSTTTTTTTGSGTGSSGGSGTGGTGSGSGGSGSGGSGSGTATGGSGSTGTGGSGSSGGGDPGGSGGGGGPGGSGGFGAGGGGQPFFTSL